MKGGKHMAVQAPPRGRLLTVKELADRWNCSISSIYKRASRKTDPLPKAGAIGIRFDPVEAEEWRRRNTK